MMIGKEVGSMPIYEYQCAGCGRVTEKWQKVSDPPLDQCPACGGSLHKLISCCSFQLKGSGWYVTDYAGKMQSAHMAGTTSDSGSGNGTQEGSEKPKTESAETSAPPKKFK
jgi:putative FmdB family regulatory protein